MSPSTADMYAQAMRFSGLIDAGIIAMRETSETYAQAEADYRKAKAEAWVRCPREDRTAAQREAWVDAETADLRYQRDLQAGLNRAAIEAVRSRRAQLSAIQTFANAERAEAEFARTGP